MRPRIPLLLACAALALGCGPGDAVLSYAFGLEPIAVITLPAADDIDGVKAASFATAKGTVYADPARRTVQLVFDGIPHMHAKTDRALQLKFVLGKRTIAPQSAMAPLDPEDQPLEEVLVADLDADHLGRVRTSVEPDVDLSRVVSAHLDVVLGLDSGLLRTYRVLEGRVGNLANAGGGATPPPTSSGGHTH